MSSPSGGHRPEMTEIALFQLLLTSSAVVAGCNNRFGDDLLTGANFILDFKPSILISPPVTLSCVINVVSPRGLNLLISS
ncbi:hypothetical protein AB1N83_005981 [Pleurotus pulmonarius]